MKATKMTGLTIILIVVSFLMTTVISVRSLRTVINDNAEDMTTILSARIYDTINSELSEPIMVARTMSNDSFLKQQLRLEDSVSEEEMLSRMEEYLYTIKNELGYNTSFVVSENSRKYYTYEGLNKIVLPELDEHDIWYSVFLDGGKKYDFDVGGVDMPGGKHILGMPKGKHVFGTVKVGEKGQIVIPKEARTVFGIQPGDTLLVLGDEENGIVVTRPEVIHDVAAKILGNLEQGETK